jgi:hypothetical protein
MDDQHGKTYFATVAYYNTSNMTSITVRPQIMRKPHPLFAVSFVLGGLLVGLGFYVLLTLAHMESGMSAGPVPASPSIRPLIVLFELFFLLGVVASLLPQVTARRALGVAAHSALLLAVLYLWHVGLPIVNVISGCILITLIIYAFCWVPMLHGSGNVA